MTGGIFSSDLDDNSDRPPRFTLFPNVEVKIMNLPGDEEVLEGAEGELWARGPNLLKGYWRNEEATKATFASDGWLKTGDIAYISDAGHVEVVARKSVRHSVTHNRFHKS